MKIFYEQLFQFIYLFFLHKTSRNKIITKLLSFSLSFWENKDNLHVQNVSKICKCHFNDRFFTQFKIDFSCKDVERDDHLSQLSSFRHHISLQLSLKLKVYRSFYSKLTEGGDSVIYLPSWSLIHENAFVFLIFYNLETFDAPTFSLAVKENKKYTIFVTKWDYCTFWIIF